MTMTDCILSWLDRASNTDIMAGMSWYPNTHLIARECDDVVKGAGIIAALSPRMPWVRNIELARVAFSGAYLFRGCLGINIRATNAILDGNHPLDVLNGLKTRAFFDNILNPLTSTAVTVDTHAIKIAGINKDSVNKGLYNEIADAYRDASRIAGMAPLELQAVTWTAYRRINSGDWRDIRA